MRYVLALLLALSGTAPERTSTLRLYVLDCGALNTDPAGVARYHVTEQEAGDPRMAVPCFLVVHPKGAMLWDVGTIPDADVEKTVASDDTIDIAIVTKPRIDKLVKNARIITATKELATGPSPDQVYVVGSSFATEQPMAAKALIDFLGGPEAKKVYEAKGLKTS